MWYFLIATALLLGSCSVTAPEFRRIESVKLQSAGKQGLLLQMDVVLFNPNKQSGTLEEIALDIMLNNRKMGTGKEVKKSEVKGKSEFILPLSVMFSPEGSFQDMFQNILQVLTAQTAELRVQGTLLMQKAGHRISFPVRYSKTISLGKP